MAKLSKIKKPALFVLVSLLIGTLFSLIASPAIAQITNPVVGEWGQLDNSCSAAPMFVSYFVLIWKVIINIGAIIVLIMLLYGGIEWITSGGDSGKLQKARERILHAVLGIIILVASFTIISFVSSTFFGDNFDILNFSLPTALDCNNAGSGGNRGNKTPNINMNSATPASTPTSTPQPGTGGPYQME